MDWTRMDEEEAIDKKNKGLALKTSIPSSGKSEDDNAEGLDAKNLNLLVRRLKKFLKKKRDFRNGTFQPKRNLKKGKPYSSNGFTCFKCGKTSHIKVDCPIYQKKQEGKKKNKGSFKKKKKAYVAWDDNESTTSIDNNEEKEVNLCLMATNEVESEVNIFVV